ncbi:MAG: GAF domain-containing protein, partial [Rhodospirillales bacterium]
MGKTAPLPDDEGQRLATLRDLEILDTPEEEAFDAVTRFAAEIFETEIALVSLVDSDRQWFLSHHGLEARETPRELSFCAHAILTPSTVMVVPDARQDDRFSDSALVTGSPNIRFYAGAPIIARDGMPLGAFCIIDSNQRPPLDDRQQHLLRHFAELAMHEIELRKSRQDALRRNRILHGQFSEVTQQVLLSVIKRRTLIAV